MLENLSATETVVLVAFLCGAIGVVSFTLVKAINAGKKYLQEKTDNALLNITLEILGESAKTIVEGLNQSLVNDLKEKSADGKLTKEEIADIQSKALTALKNTLSDEAKDVMKKIFGNLDVFLSALLDAKVGQVKKEKAETPLKILTFPEIEGEIEESGEHDVVIEDEIDDEIDDENAARG